MLRQIKEKKAVDFVACSLKKNQNKTKSECFQHGVCVLGTGVSIFSCGRGMRNESEKM